jgi:hypothetical protein
LISLAELESVGDVSVAREMIIVRKVDDLLRKSLDDWNAWFERIGVKCKDLVEDWTSLTEIFARRNVMVHAGGVVNQRYLRAVGTAGMKTPELPPVGTKLGLDEEYLLTASDTLLSLGMLLLSATWMKLRRTRNPERPVGWIPFVVQHLLNLGYYLAARDISNAVLATSRGRLGRSAELNLTISRWVARREMGEADQVRSEVGAWEVDGLDLKYAHARAVLLGDDDRSVMEILELQRRGELSTVEIHTSPLYREIVQRRGDDLSMGNAAKPPELEGGCPVE